MSSTWKPATTGLVANCHGVSVTAVGPNSSSVVPSAITSTTKSSVSSAATRIPSTSTANDRISATRSVPTPIHRMPFTSTDRAYANSRVARALPRRGSVEPMAAKDTPAIRTLRAAGVAFSVHECAHDPRAESYALEAAGALALDPAVVFKTLVVDLDGRLSVCLIPSGDQLDMRALGKRAALADPQRAQKVTGYVTGGISPLRQRRRLPPLRDDPPPHPPPGSVSPGRRGPG